MRIGIFTFSFFLISHAQKDVELWDTEPLTLTTPTGEVHGMHYKTADRKKEQVFLGIPYATSERFQKSTSITKYDHPINATRAGNICPQIRGRMISSWLKIPIGEECLSLNIYAPENTGKLLPVMVYIHGGSLRFGLGYLSPDLAYEQFVSKDVVLVTIQYRLGFLGVFGVKHILTPGRAQETIFESNIGLGDQINALRWIQGNIKSFGGDPNSVTIFGESGGACSVSALNLIPNIENFFHRSIALSGTTEMCFDGSFGYRDLAAKFAKKYCHIDIRSTEMTTVDLRNFEECMLKLDAQETNDDFEKDSFTGWYWVPDDWLLTDVPQRLIGQNNNTRELIIGITKEDWSMYELELIHDGKKKLEDYNRNSLREYLFKALGFNMPKESLQLMEDFLVEKYNMSVLEDDNHVGWLSKTNDVGSDATFVNFAVREATTYAKSGNKVFLYEFTEPYPNTQIPGYYPVEHCTDHQYLFKQGKVGPTGDILSKLFTDFAHGRNPLPQPLDLASWNYYDISNNGIGERTNYRPLSRALWANSSSPIYMDYPKAIKKRAWMTPSDTLY